MNQTQETKDPSIAATRLKVMGALALLVFVVIAARLWGVQIRRGEEFQEMSRSNFFQWRRLEHPRGEILDREGRVLVTNRPSVDVYVIPAFFPATRRMVRNLSGGLALSGKTVDALVDTLIKTASERGPALLLARGLEERQVERLRSRQGELELPLEAVPILAIPEEPEHYAAYLDPDAFPTTPLVLRRLQEVVGLDEENFEMLERRIRKATGLARYQEILVRRDVPPEVEGRLAQEIELGELPGVVLEIGNARHYRYDDLAAHLLGYVSEISPKELEDGRDDGYRLGDQVGKAGVERTFEDELRGIDGRETIVVDSKGRSQGGDLAEVLQQNVGVKEPPRPGNRLVLTVDLDVQEVAEQAFMAQKPKPRVLKPDEVAEPEPGPAGAVVVLEVETGRVLAMTSTPSFNPNRLVGYVDPAEKARLDAMSAARPWRFRAIQDFFAPGSTFKVITALAALQQRITTPTEHVNCPGAYRLGSTRFRCWREAGHGPVDLTAALAKSCDVYFYTMGARLGLDPIAEVGHGLGLGHTTGVALAHESPGIMPDENWYRRNLPEGYTLGAAVNASIGQGAVSTTPIQLAVAYAAIANGGTVYEPQVALRTIAADGTAHEVAPKVVNRLAMPEGAYEQVREGLRQVVNEPFGTAYKRRLEGLQVAGKTGTAQVAKLGGSRLKPEQLPWKLRDNAWFAAFAPAEHPEIVVVVLHEHGGGGSSAAAPIAMAVVRAWHEKKQARAGLDPRSPVTLALLTEAEDDRVEEASWPR